MMVESVAVFTAARRLSWSLARATLVRQRPWPGEFALRPTLLVRNVRSRQASMASSPQKMVGCGRWRGSERHGDCPHPRPSPRLGIRILFSARGPRLPALAPVAPAPGRGPRPRYLPALLPPSLHLVLLGSSGAAWFHWPCHYHYLWPSITTVFSTSVHTYGITDMSAFEIHALFQTKLFWALLRAWEIKLTIKFKTLKNYILNQVKVSKTSILMSSRPSS
jgi:hypothetical protein